MGRLSNSSWSTDATVRKMACVNVQEFIRIPITRVISTGAETVYVKVLAKKWLAAGLESFGPRNALGSRTMKRSFFTANADTS